MKITKLEHSGIIVEKDGKTIIFDPVEFTEKLPTFENVVAIIVTHRHSDHYQPDKLARILDAAPGAKILTTSDTAATLQGATIVKAGDTLDIDGFSLEFFGKDHANILPGQIPCENIGAVIDGKIINPGDSFDLPSIKPQVLLVPLSAPWCKISESIDFIKRARPSVVIPIHDAVLSDLGKGFNHSWLKTACDEVGASYSPLRPGESLSIS